jgi:hypothetical protein
MRFQVLTAASMKMEAFWDIAPCSLVGVDPRFRDAYCLRHHPDKEAVRTSETSVCSKETTWCYIPEGFHFQIQIY